MGFDGQVGTSHGGPQIGIRCATAPALAHGHVHPAESFLLRAVDIGGVRIARLGGGGKPRGMQGIAQRAIARFQLAAAAPIGVAPLLALFRAPEVGQHVAVRPACRTLGSPAVEVQRIAADIDQSIDRR